MALEIVGNIKKIEPIQSGEGARGVWKKRVLVISTGEQFVKDIAFIAWNDIAEALDELGRGQKVKIQFSLESREFNGKWYTDARIWKIKVIKGRRVREETDNLSNTRTLILYRILLKDDHGDPHCRKKMTVRKRPGRRPAILS